MLYYQLDPKVWKKFQALGFFLSLIMKRLIVYFIILFGFLIIRWPVQASSAKLVMVVSENQAESAKNEKIIKLTSFLKEKKSPLTPYARILVEEAEKNDLDWRLVPAIAGVESSFGKFIPEGSYNAYGWANGNYFFSSWEEGIKIVTQTLNEKYSKVWQAKTPWEIGKYYAASPTWPNRVSFFMEQIENHTPKPADFTLNL